MLATTKKEGVVPVCIMYVCTVRTAYGSLMTHVVKNMLGYVIGHDMTK